LNGHFGLSCIQTPVPRVPPGRSTDCSFEIVTATGDAILRWRDARRIASASPNAASAPRVRQLLEESGVNRRWEE
jgi:hypothetical protein